MEHLEHYIEFFTNDDASGTAAILEVARVLAALPGGLRARTAGLRRRRCTDGDTPGATGSSAAAPAAGRDGVFGAAVPAAVGVRGRGESEGTGSDEGCGDEQVLHGERCFRRVVVERVDADGAGPRDSTTAMHVPAASSRRTGACAPVPGSAVFRFGNVCVSPA